MKDFSKLTLRRHGPFWVIKLSHKGRHVAHFDKSLRKAFDRAGLTGKEWERRMEDMK